MSHKLIFFASLLGTALLSSTAHSRELSLQSSVASQSGLIEVPGKRILLGHLDPTLPRELMTVDIAPSPFPGKTLSVSRDAVKRALGRAGYDPKYASGLPVQQKVRRASRLLRRPDLEKEIRGQLKGMLPIGVVVEKVKGLKDVLLPTDEHELKLRINRLSRTTMATVQVRTNERQWASFNLSILLAGQAQIPTLRGDLPRKSIIEGKDIIMVPTDLEDISLYSTLRKEELVGKKLIQPAKAKKSIARNTVKRPPTIARGKEVTLIVKASGVRVSQPATADEDGAMGEWIRVRPLAGTRPIRAKVVSPNRVVMNIEESN